MDVVLRDIFIFEYSPFEKIKEIPQLFYNVNEKWLYPFNAILYTLILFIIFFLFEKRAQVITLEETSSNTVLMLIGKVFGLLIVSALSVALLAFDNFLIILLIPGLFPFLFLWAYAIYKGKVNFISALGKTFSMYSANFSNVLGLSFSIFLIFVFFYSFNQLLLFWLIVDMLVWNLSLDQSALDELINMLLLLFAHFNVVLGFTIYTIGGAFSYYSFSEELEAKSLLEKIDDIQFDSQIRGIAKEV